jgi:D-alanyl-lipoteichoic acid acyltransferase DltB (MBOAT superfamily)
MVTMLLGGLWHGASWTFVFWGGLHGAYLVVNHFWQWLRERVGFASPGGEGRGVRGWLGRAAGVALTLLCVMVGWVYFRATELHIANGIVASMFGLNEGGVRIESLAGYSEGILPWLIGFSALALFARNSQWLIDGAFTRWLDRRSSSAWFGELLAFLIGALCVAIVFLAIAAASRNVTEFIYFNF